MARNIIQALEGIAFPADRSRLVDHARRNNLTARTLSALESMPQRTYSSMTEVLAALPSKGQMRRQSTSASGQQRSPEQPSERADQQGKRQPERQEQEEEEEEEKPERSNVAQWPRQPLQQPTQAPADPFGLQGLAMEWTRTYLQFWQRMLSGWIK
jgi:hypothetical protein